MKTWKDDGIFSIIHRFNSRCAPIFLLLTAFVCLTGTVIPAFPAPVPKIMDWEIDPRLDREGIVSTLLLDDGSALKGTVKYDSESSKYTITTAHGAFSFAPESVLGILGVSQTEKIGELRECLSNIRTISKAIQRYVDKFGREGISRMKKWQRNSLYLLLLQVEHEFERTPKCPFKWGVYTVTDAVAAKVSCSRHGRECDLLRNIRSILAGLDNEIPLAPIDPEANEDSNAWKLPEIENRGKKKVR